MRREFIVLGLSFILLPFFGEAVFAKKANTNEFEQKAAYIPSRQPSIFNRSFGHNNGICPYHGYPRHSSLGSRLNPWNRGVITGFTPPPVYNYSANTYYPSSTGFSFRNLFNRNRNVPYYSTNNFNNSNGVWNNNGIKGIQIFSNGVPNSTYSQNGFNYIENQGANGGATVKIID